MARVKTRTNDSETGPTSAAVLDNAMVIPPADDEAELAELDETAIDPEILDDEELPATQPGFPRPPGMNIAAEQFFAYLQKLRETDWARCIIYVYRLWPVIRRPPKSKNIDKISRPIDLHYLLKLHGSGDYRLLINDRDIKGQHKTLCQTVVRVRDEHFPTRLNLEDLVIEDPINKPFVEECIRAGRLSPQGDIVQSGQQQPDPSAAVLAKGITDLATAILTQNNNRKPDNGLEASTISKALDIISTAGQKSVEMALSQVQQQDPDKFIKLIAAVKELAPSGGNEKLFELLLKTQADSQRQIAEAQKQQTDLLLKFIESRQSNQSATTQLKEMAEMFAIMKEAFGGGGDDAPAGGRKWWQQMLPAVVQPFAQAAAPLMTNWLMRMQMPRPPAGPAPQAAPPAEPGQPALPPPAPNPQQPQEDAMFAQYQQMFAQIAPAILNHMNAGGSGHDFAAWLIDGYGQMVYGAVCGLGKEKLIALAQSSPELWGALAPVADQFDQFVDEFLAGPDATEAEDVEPAPPLAPEPVPAPARKKGGAR